jgi:polyhydroxybutyrate depolymerase
VELSGGRDDPACDEERGEQMRSSAAGTTNGGWRRGAPVVLAVASAVLVLGACVPPPAPGPTVRPQPDGRGKVAEVDVAPSAGCTSTGGLPAGHSALTIAVGSGQRSARVDVPASATGDTPAPVLVSLHPFSVNGAGWEGYSHLAQAAVARGYVVITPTGSQPGPRWNVPGGVENNVDDIGYVSQLLDAAEDGACIDRNREFAAGFSAGAAMAQALSCTLPWRMSAVAASGGANLTDLCPASPATDVMVLHGSADPIAPTTGSDVPFATPNGLHIDDVVATDAARAGCAPVPSTEQLFDDVVVDRYTGCDGGARVEYWQLLGAGHTWAGTTAPLLEIVTGPTNQSISATEQVLDFFDSAA